MMVNTEQITHAVHEVRASVSDVARRCGRSPEEITLIAVSKLHPVEALLAAMGAGQRHFGENYIQEALGKQQELEKSGDHDLRWHFTGRLQSNKAKYIPGNFCLVHAIDSIKLARAVHSRAEHQAEATGSAFCQDVLIEVNLAREEQKAGIDESALPQLAETMEALPAIHLCGLMVLPPFSLSVEKRRPFFARLRELRDGLQQRLGRKLPTLSMGMTDDYIQAIEEGATLVRVGTRIFGPRPAKQ